MSRREDYIKKHLLESAQTKKQIAEQMTDQISQAANLLILSIKQGGKIMFCGNGGSAADSQHLATEMVVRLSSSLDRGALPALALTTDTSILTACGNDYGFDHIFSRQVDALGREPDILIGISTSGNSANIIKAIETARSKKLTTIGLLGKNGGKLRDLVDLAVVIPSDDVQHIQEAHITIGHILIALVEMELVSR
jgi:D-sedoheptulose 7-phosphate isomerase